MGLMGLEGMCDRGVEGPRLLREELNPWKRREIFLLLKYYNNPGDILC